MRIRRQGLIPIMLVSIMFFLILICGSRAGAAERYVLLLGNSLTFENKLDRMLQRVAGSAGVPLHVERYAKSNYTLQDHVDDPGTLKALKSHRWDVVVLQEQSLIPSIRKERLEKMLPAARTLGARIRAQGARVMLYMTWGYRDGTDPERDDVNYSYTEMQEALVSGYNAIARDLNAPVADVGWAWMHARMRFPQLELYQDDGKHPSLHGTYLAALRMFAVMCGRSPRGVRYIPAGISTRDAAMLKAAACITHAPPR